MITSNFGFVCDSSSLNGGTQRGLPISVFSIVDDSREGITGHYTKMPIFHLCEELVVVGDVRAQGTKTSKGSEYWSYAICKSGRLRDVGVQSGCNS